jgi:hypothetical protein
MIRSGHNLEMNTQNSPQPLSNSTALDDSILLVLHNTSSVSPTQFDQNGFLPIHFILQQLAPCQPGFFNSAVARLERQGYVEDEVISQSPQAYQQYSAEYWWHIHELDNASTLYPRLLRLTPTGHIRARDLATAHTQQTHSSNTSAGGGAIIVIIIVVIGALWFLSKLPSQDCSQSPEQHIQSGMNAVVCTKKDPLHIREHSSTQSDVVYTLNRGDQVKVINGPVCAEQFRWWQVKTTNGSQGWVREGKDQEDTYFICPVTQ